MATRASDARARTLRSATLPSAPPPKPETPFWRRPLPVKVGLAVVDLVVVFGAMAGALALLRSAGKLGGSSPTSHYVLLAAGSLPIWLGSMMRSRLYTARYLTRHSDEARRVLHATAGGAIGLAVLAYFLHMTIGRSFVVGSFVVATVLLGFEREMARLWFRRRRHRGHSSRRVVIVGGNAEALHLHHMLSVDPSLGYEIVGFVDDAPEDRSAVRRNHSHRVLGTVEQTLRAVLDTGANGVIVATTAMDLATSNRLIRELTDAGIHVELSSTLVDIAPQRLTVRPLGRIPVVYIEPVQRHGWRAVAKRGFDVGVASFGLVITSPVLAAAAIAIKLDSSGPVFFRQQRIGRNGVPFNVLKLRTMVHDAEHKIIELRRHNEADGPLFKMRNDPRVTRIGKWLRATSLDELPQLINVLRNEMSLVGPRPALASEMDHWDAPLHGRLRVKPGITGMWQVNGRSNASFDDYARLDLYYVDNWSLVTDLAILVKTVPTVILRHGAF
ncbi:MAG: sugar transferase [Acidimicrobiia bacterium]